MNFRVIISKELDKYFIGRAYNDKKYKIEKNNLTKGFKVDGDYEFYALIKRVNFFSTTITPITDEEAGVFIRH